MGKWHRVAEECQLGTNKCLHKIKELLHALEELPFFVEEWWRVAAKWLHVFPQYAAYFRKQLHMPPYPRLANGESARKKEEMAPAMHLLKDAFR